MASKGRYGREVPRRRPKSITHGWLVVKSGRNNGYYGYQHQKRHVWRRQENENIGSCHWVEFAKWGKCVNVMVNAASKLETVTYRSSCLHKSVATGVKGMPPVGQDISTQHGWDTQ
jgi:hypothetical protein